jgi:hypothetical protein
MAALNVPLTVQEALYPGGSTGIARTNEPFCMGVPVADAAAVTGTSSLGLTGAAAAQFRILGKWPSGNAKWIKVCGIVPSLAAGRTTTVTLTDSGGGNSGGPNLAADPGGAAPITVNTGAAIFAIKKANFNVIDSVVMGSTTVVAPSTAATRGLVITGPDPAQPFPANVTCGSGSGQSACTTEYSSANDPASTCSVEENGPVMAVVRCVGNHMDRAGHVYMQYTARETFYSGSAMVKTQVILRNANYDTAHFPSNDVNGKDFNVSYKGFQSYELRVSPNISGTLAYTIATDGAPQTGSLSASDSAYIYQGQSQFMTATASGCDYQSSCANTYTKDTGYIAKKNSAAIASGDGTKAIGGWADISNSSGVGVEIGIYQMSAFWPASLEFNNGGSDVRIGMLSGRNGVISGTPQPYYQGWPHWDIHEQVLIFHAGSLPSPAASFLKYQHYLLARPASITYLNATKIWEFPIADPAAEDAFFVSLANTANPPLFGLGNTCYNGATVNCTPDLGVTDYNFPLSVYRAYAWSAGGAYNQQEARLSDMLRFLQRGQTGRFLNSSHFYRYVANKNISHSDGGATADSAVNSFKWSDRPPIHAYLYSTPQIPELDANGDPAVMSNGGITNSSQGYYTGQGIDTYHDHWSGMLDYYFLTGDEWVKEAVAAKKAFYLNNDTHQGEFYSTQSAPFTQGCCVGYYVPGQVQNGLGATRAIGIELINTGRFSEYLNAIGDPDAAGVLAQGQINYQGFVDYQGCLSGYPAGCTAPPLSYPVNSDPLGISYERGAHQSARVGNGWCGAGDNGSQSGLTGNYRVSLSYQQSITQEGILWLRRASGPTWGAYERSLDIAYGLGQWALLENFNYDGSNVWYHGSGDPAGSLYNSYRYDSIIDMANVCPPGTKVTGTVQQDTDIHGAHVYDNDSLANAIQGAWFPFYVSYLVNGTTEWRQKAQFVLDWIAYTRNGWPADFGAYPLNALIAVLNSPGHLALQDIPFTVTDLGGGNYKLTFTPPAGSTALRIKWSPKIIVNSGGPSTVSPNAGGLLGFDSMYTNAFALNPAIYATWFSANNTAEPAPTPGRLQTFTINTGAIGLTAPNFSVKAMSPLANSPTSAANLIPVSGNAQSGLPGQALPAPFTVEVTDASGLPVSGVTVTFAVTSGGGSLSATQAATNALGLASTTLTLGAGGTNTVTAASGSLFGSPVTFTATASSSQPTSSPTTLALVSGNGQSGIAGQPLPNPFVVKVADAGGNPVPGAIVTFAVTAGGGKLSATQVKTNSQGLASSTLTLGPNPGTDTVAAASGTLSGSPITFNVTATAAQPGNATSIWNDSTTPASTNFDTSALEIGLKFRSDAAGYITGVRFYKAPNNTGSHIGNLWTASGTLLASVAFSNETPSGWQQATFANPVAIGPNTTYIVSYYAPHGGFSYDLSYFANSGVDNAPLHALASGVDGPNGVYVYGADAFPNQTYYATNYWVDVTFSANHSGVASVPGSQTLSLACGSGPAELGQPYSSALVASAGTAPYIYSITGSLPPGLTLNRSTGAVTGTPITPGTFNFTARALDAAGKSATQACTITVAALPGGTLAANLALVSGNGQTGTAGHQLQNPFVVQVTDAGNHPVSGATVTFTVIAGGGSLTATSAVTDNQGFASSALTLGPNPGVNIVTVASGTLAGSPVIFTAIAVSGSSSGQSVIDWTKQPPPANLPGWLGYLTLPYDPVSQQTLLFANSGGIYSSKLLAYNASTNVFTQISDDGSTSDVCVADQPDMPGNRHPDGQMAVDTKRNVLWIYGGLNQNCGVNYVSVNGNQVTNLNTSSSQWLFPTNHQLDNQTITIGGLGNFTVASVQDSTHLTLTTSAGSCANCLMYMLTGSEASPRQDMYYLTLNPDPTQDVWHQVTPAHWPSSNSISTMVYDPDDDLLFVLGANGSNLHVNWRYCPTLGSSTPGKLSAVQVRAGCTVPDDWTEDVVTGGVNPEGLAYPGLLYDSVTKKVIQYGGNGSATNHMWAYDVPSKTWTQKCAGTCLSPPPYVGGQGVNYPAWAYNSLNNKIYYRQTSNSGSPADWQYDPATDTWTQLAGAGIGPTGLDANFAPYMAYDPKVNALITWSQPGTLLAEIWLGQLPTALAGPAERPVRGLPVH